MYKVVFFVCFLTSSLGFSQEDSTYLSTKMEDDGIVEAPEEPKYVEDIFNSTRVINGHSTDMIPKNMMEFRISHRFGDFAGSNGGAQQMFGFDQISDIRIAFEYGVTDNINIGLGRSKGNGMPYRSLMDGYFKYRFLRQKPHGMPISAVVLGTTSYSYMKASADLSQVSSFPKWQYRFAYCAQIIISRKFAKWFSASLSPTIVHRNYVKYDDQNTLFALGGGMRFAIKPTLSLLVEYFHVFNDPHLRTTNTNSLSFAVEFVTFGHHFKIILTNATGFGETQFITNTYSNWLKGQFRLGFSIGRNIALKRK